MDVKNMFLQVTLDEEVYMTLSISHKDTSNPSPAFELK
jgi:hypothetical protein